MAYSVLQIFPGLEASIREFARCEFYFGDDESSRDAQPPKIIWTIGSGEPTGIERQTPVSGVISPRSFAADEVHIGARVMGAATPSAAVNEKTPRAQDFAASELLVCALRWALHRCTNAGWLGAHKWMGWTVVWPEGPSDRGVYLDCVFSVRVQIMAPEPLYADPPLTQTFQPITLGA